MSALGDEPWIGDLLRGGNCDGGHSGLSIFRRKEHCAVCVHFCA